jgi:ubiquinone/menaquinone biosynthesis C-methylase UbiE
MTTAEGPYLFSHSWEGEGERLSGITDAFDPVTRRQLTEVGVSDGWRCLEVGAGTGTIAAWLAGQVGPKGHVLATDISLALMEQRGLAAGNLELRRHDILNEPMPDGEFDLIHSRLVLEHLPGREDALARMAGALAPGGWLVVEEITFGTEKALDRRAAVLLGGLLQVVKILMQRKGFDGTFGRKLPVHFSRLGLTEVSAEGTQLVLIGGTPSVEWARPSLTRFRHLLFEDTAAGVLPKPVQKVLAAAPGLRRAAERRLDGLDRLLADPEFVYLAPTFISARGRRPA